MSAWSQPIKLMVEGMRCPIISDLVLAFVWDQFGQSFEQFDRSTSTTTYANTNDHRSS
jgi:hypothetical protein